MDQKGAAAILAVKRLTDATPAVNLKIPLHAGDKARKRGIHPDFETQKSKIEVPVDSQKGFMSSKTKKIKIKTHTEKQRQQ